MHFPNLSPHQPFQEFFWYFPLMSFCKCLVSCCILRSQMFISNQSDLLSSTGCRYKDNNRNCPSWKARGYCTHTYQEYMRRNCQKSCFCGTSELIFSLTCLIKFIKVYHEFSPYVAYHLIIITSTLPGTICNLCVSFVSNHIDLALIFTNFFFILRLKDDSIQLNEWVINLFIESTFDCFHRHQLRWPSSKLPKLEKERFLSSKLTVLHLHVN